MKNIDPETLALTALLVQDFKATSATNRAVKLQEVCQMASDVVVELQLFNESLVQKSTNVSVQRIVENSRTIGKMSGLITLLQGYVETLSGVSVKGLPRG